MFIKLLKDAARPNQYFKVRYPKTVAGKKYMCKLLSFQPVTQFHTA